MQMRGIQQVAGNPRRGTFATEIQCKQRAWRSSASHVSLVFIIMIIIVSLRGRRELST